MKFFSIFAPRSRQADVAPPETPVDFALRVASIFGEPENELTPQVRTAFNVMIGEIDRLRLDVEQLKLSLTEAEASADHDPLAPVYNRRAFVREANPNFFLMLGGHVFNGDGDGEGHRTNTFNGNKVFTLVSNYQGRFNGGNGLMRLMYFSPSNNTISIKTYSPYTGTYETDANSQFTLPYNMQANGAGAPGTPYVALGTNINVPPGSLNTFAWSGLQPNKTYEWYARVDGCGGQRIYHSRAAFHHHGQLRTYRLQSNCHRHRRPSHPVDDAGGCQ